MAARNSRAVFTLLHTESKGPYQRIGERIETFSQLTQRLDELKGSRTDQYSVGVHLRNSSGDCFAIGLADEGWLLIFDDHTHSNMRYSLGDVQAVGNVEYVFEQWESLPKRYLVPPETALLALRTWMETDKLSASIRWEDNPY